MEQGSRINEWISQRSAAWYLDDFCWHDRPIRYAIYSRRATACDGVAAIVCVDIECTFPFPPKKRKAMLDKRSRCDVLCDQVCLNGTHMALRFWFADIYNVPTVTAALHSSRRYLIVAY